MPDTLASLSPSVSSSLQLFPHREDRHGGLAGQLVRPDTGRRVSNKLAENTGHPAEQVR